MPADKLRRPATRPGLLSMSVEDPATDRALSELGAAVSRLDGAQRPRVSLVVDLIVGSNVINHGLGRVPKHAHVTPTTADATFAYALTDATDRQVTITVVGVAQPGAGLELA